MADIAAHMHILENQLAGHDNDAEIPPPETPD
jgi:hypothetical protein